MEKTYEVQWYKERYPLPDESGKQTFNTRREAALFAWRKNQAGYKTMQFDRYRDEDED